MPDLRYGFKNTLPGLVALALVSVTLLNIFQFRSIEEDAGTYYSAISLHGDSGLIDIVQSHMGTTQDRFLMYLELGELTNSPIILVDPDAWVHTEELYGLAGAHNVLESAEDISISSDHAQRIREQAAAKGYQREAGEYIISGAKQSLQEVHDLIVVVEHNAVLYLVAQPWSALPVFEGDNADD